MYFFSRFNFSKSIIFFLIFRDLWEFFRVWSKCLSDTDTCSCCRSWTRLRWRRQYNHACLIVIIIIIILIIRGNGTRAMTHDAVAARANNNYNHYNEINTVVTGRCIIIIIVCGSSRWNPVATSAPPTKLSGPTTTTTTTTRINRIYLFIHEFFGPRPKICNISKPTVRRNEIGTKSVRRRWRRTQWNRENRTVIDRRTRDDGYERPSASGPVTKNTTTTTTKVYCAARRLSCIRAGDDDDVTQLAGLCSTKLRDES